jgi:uncharacterized metal-binding protein YceD (DUF177 family)
MHDDAPSEAKLPSQPYRSALVSGRKPLRFHFTPSETDRALIAQALDLLALPEFSFKGELSPQGRSDVVLRADLSALVVQPCSVTLAPVRTRLSESTERRFVRDFIEPEAEEWEIPAEDVEALPEVIDVAAIAIEALALALPLYPRAKDATFEQTAIAAPGVEPLKPESLKPFAGLADKLKKPGESGV